MQKGAASHMACGMTSCPPIASTCIRANWRMLGVMNQYIKYEGAGEQYVGWCVSGKNRLGKGFAESLPYFDSSHFDSVQKGLKRREVDQWVKARMPGGTLNESVFALFMICIASFIYHKSWLDKTVYPEHALWCSPFWSETIPSSEHVITCYPWNRSEDAPEFTGLPVAVDVS